MLQNLISKTFASVLLALSVPVIVLVSLLIMAESGFPVIFSQWRRGKDRQSFKVFKFRTMQNGNVTEVGRFLRKSGLDELPQLINILKGEMSFVGPRPLTEEDIERLGWNNPSFEERWSVKPGITGPAQLERICSAQLSIQHDLEYVRRRSIRYDIKLLVETALTALNGKRTT